MYILIYLTGYDFKEKRNITSTKHLLYIQMFNTNSKIQKITQLKIIKTRFNKLTQGRMIFNHFIAIEQCNKY